MLPCIGHVHGLSRPLGDRPIESLTHLETGAIKHHISSILLSLHFKLLTVLLSEAREKFTHKKCLQSFKRSSELGRFFSCLLSQMKCRLPRSPNEMTGRCWAWVCFMGTGHVRGVGILKERGHRSHAGTHQIYSFGGCQGKIIQNRI